MTIEKHIFLTIPEEDQVVEPIRKYPAYLGIVRVGFQIFGRLFPRKAAKLALKMFTTPMSRARHKEPDALLAEARIFEVLAGANTIKCYEWGKIGQPTVLLLHGWESRGTALRSFVPPLVAQGYRVVAMDAPASGDSSGKRLHLPLYAQAIQSVWHHVGENVKGVITHSFGGAAVLYGMSYLFPKVEIDKMVMIGAPNTMKEIMDNLRKTLNLPSKTYAYFLKEIEAIAKMPLDKADVHQMPGAARVKEIILIHDSTDKITTLAGAKAIVNAMPQAQLVETNGLGHFQLVKHPLVIEKVGAFFRE